MKKKLFLLPIALLSTFLGACTYRTEFIPLKDIFNIDKQNNFGYFSYKNQDYCDYKGDISNIFKTYVGEAEVVKKIDSGISSLDYNLNKIDYRFNISGDYKKMNYFFVTAFETGDIEVRVSGAGWPMSPEDQNTLYKLNDEATGKLFQEITTYTEDMIAGLEEEKEAAKEASTIDKFLAAYSTLENRKVTYSYSGHDSKIKRPYVREIDISDKDGEYLELLVDLEYKRYSDDVTYGFDEYIHVSSSDCIKVNADEGWRMTLDYKEATGYMYYEYKSKYQGLASYTYYFSVNQSKINALYEKIYNEIKNQIE